MHSEIAAMNERSLKGLQALMDLIDAGPPDEALPTEDELRPLLVGWGALAALARQASASLTLFNAGLGHEAAPNRRLMIEYMALLQWLARDRENAVDAINTRHQESQRRLRKAADTADIQYDVAGVDAMAAIEIGGDKSFHVFNSTSPLLQSLAENMVGDWANAGWSKRLTAMWMGETQLSHATLTAVQRFIELKADEVHLLNEPRYPIAEDPVEASPTIVFTFLAAGAEAFNDLLVGRPWTTELARIAVEYGLKQPDGVGDE